MRYVTYERDGAQRLGAVVNDRVIDVAEASGGALPSDMLSFIRAGHSAWQRARQLLSDGNPKGTSIASTRLLAPIPRPARNIFCLGLNYADHAAESAQARGREQALPQVPVYFTKATTAVIGPDVPIPWHPDVSTSIDWEAEFGVVIGITGTSIGKERALEHVFGYTLVNDVTARDLQTRHNQWFKGKSLDGSAPMGPWIVTADEIPDPQVLDITCRVNGQVKQHSNTRNMIFDVPTIIADLSRGLTLEAGDVISTGTPEGVGFARKPPEFLKPGDQVEVEVEKIGVLRNPIAAG